MLNAAANALGEKSVPVPRPGQFVYLRTVHVTGGLRQTAETWSSEDGTRAGLTRSRGFLGSQTLPIDVYDPAKGLQGAPCTVLAELPTDRLRC